jgi:hypothetical protein
MYTSSAPPLYSIFLFSTNSKKYIDSNYFKILQLSHLVLLVHIHKNIKHACAKISGKNILSSRSRSSGTGRRPAWTRTNRTRATADLPLLRALRGHEAPPPRCRPPPLDRRRVQAAPRHPRHPPARFLRICPRPLALLISLASLPLTRLLTERFWRRRWGVLQGRRDQVQGRIRQVHQGQAQWRLLRLPRRHRRAW